MLSFSIVSNTGLLSHKLGSPKEKLHISLGEHFINKEPFEQELAISILNVCPKHFALLHITDLYLKHCLTINVFMPHAISNNFLLDGDATA